MNSNSLAGEKGGTQSGGPKNSQIDLGEGEAGRKEGKVILYGPTFFPDSEGVRSMDGECSF